MREETRTRTLEEVVYIADDGKEFYDERSCKQHEEDKLFCAAWEYIREHAVAQYDDGCRDGIPGFVGLDGYEGCIIRCDDFIIDWLDYLSKSKYADVHLKRENTEKYRGELLFICYGPFDYAEEWYIYGTTKDVRAAMAEAIDELYAMEIKAIKENK